MGDTTPRNQGSRESFERRALHNAGIPRIGSQATAQQTTSGPVTIPTQAALDQAVADLEHAHDEGSAAPTLLATLGNDLLYRGLIQREDADIRQSRQYAEQALDKFRQQEQAADLLANTQFVLAEDDLVLGDSASTDEYRAAEAQLRSNAVNSEVVVGSALTDLSLIEDQHPVLAGRVEQVKAQIVAQGSDVYGVTPNGNSGQGHANHMVHFGQIKAEPDPGHALYLIQDPGSFNPDNDRLSVQWEYRDPVHGEWAVLPEISGPVTKGELVSAFRSGAFILSIPKAAAVYQSNKQALVGLMEATVQGFSGKGSPLAGLQSQAAAHSTPYFMSSGNGQEEFWTYGQGDVYSGVGTSANGQIYVGITWGRTNDQAFQLFLSLSPL